MGATQKLEYAMFAVTGLIVGFVLILFALALNAPPVKPTIRMFWDNNVFCCTTQGKDLLCKDGTLLIHNATNWLDTKKECN
jgi:hypothetical protein